MTVRARQVAIPADIDLKGIDFMALEAIGKYFFYSRIKIVHDEMPSCVELFVIRVYQFSLPYITGITYKSNS